MRALPAASISSASVTTAPSTQPPVIEPSMLPWSSMTIIAPGGQRGGALHLDQQRLDDAPFLGQPGDRRVLSGSYNSGIDHTKSLSSRPLMPRRLPAAPAARKLT